mgnify:CR=1 FL=1
MLTQEPSRPVAPRASGSLDKKLLANVPQNAFIESIPEAGAGQVGQDSKVLYSLTDAFAQGLSGEVLAANPNGPRGSGEDLAVAVPDFERYLSNFIDDEDVQAEVLAEVAAREIRAESLKLVDDTPANLQKYAEGYRAVLEGVSSPNLIAMLGKPASQDNTNALSTVLGSAVNKLKKLSVPKKFSALHLSTLRVLSYGEQGMAVSSAADPLKEVAVLEMLGENYFNDIQTIQSELGKLQSLGAVEQESLFSMLLGIRTAHAQWVTFSPAEFLRDVWEYIKKFITEIIKDRLVHRLVNQTINWIQGGGKPQFVTNWKAFLRDAGNEAAGRVIEAVAPGLCRPFGPLIRVALLPINNIEPPVTCTLDQVVDNIEDFYNDFYNGGWIAYGASLRPENNLIGSLIETADRVAIEREKAERDALLKATGEGFKPTENCLREDFIYGWKTYPGKDGNLTSRKWEAVPGTKHCIEYNVTTPGTVLGQATYNAIGAPLQRIVNAQDLVNLFSALVNSALNKMITAGKKGLAGLKQDAQAKNLVDACSQMSGQARTECVKSAREIAASANRECENLPPEEREECRLEVVEPPPEGCSAASCDAPDIPIKYDGDVNGAIDRNRGGADVTTEAGIAAFKEAVVNDLRSQGFIGNATAINCNGNPSSDALIIGKAGDEYAEYFDVVQGAGGTNPAPGIGYSQPADWKRCQGCGQTSPNICQVSGGGTANICPVGTTRDTTATLSGADTTATSGYWCNNDPFSMSQNGNVLLVCPPGVSGTAFIAQNTTDCNVRPDRGTPGWTFESYGGSTTRARDPSGTEVDFLATMVCANAQTVAVPAGNYTAGLFTTQGGSGTAAICK